jgi:hypothetical protein
VRDNEDEGGEGGSEGMGSELVNSPDRQLTD